MANLHHSQENLSNNASYVLLLGTGGTIAGLTNQASADMQGYHAAQLGIDALLAGVSMAAGRRVRAEQTAQIDSKDMNFVVWEQLYARLCEAMSDHSVASVVITHGTDTLEETAYFLHRALLCSKPVILTGAMRPADSTSSDGLRNLSDAFNFSPQLAAGVWVVFAGQVLPAAGIQKKHPQNLEAFGLREMMPITSTSKTVPPVACLNLPIKHWPRVEIVMNYAGATGALVDALVMQKVGGIVVAGTGNGTVSASLKAALDKACKAGVAVCLTTRCAAGSVQLSGELDGELRGDQPFQVSPLSPVQARVDLLIHLIELGQLGNQLNFHTSA
jgi:L-asparaginase